MTTDAELRALLLDCLQLWDLRGTVTAETDGLVVRTDGASCTVRPGPRPTRWFVITEARTRPVPSMVALLAAVRRALGVPPGVRARVGVGAEPG